MLGWAPSEFWSASFHEITTALAVRLRMSRNPDDEPMTDDQLWSLLDAHDAAISKH